MAQKQILEATSEKQNAYFLKIKCSLLGHNMLLLPNRTPNTHLAPAIRKAENPTPPGKTAINLNVQIYGKFVDYVQTKLERLVSFSLVSRKGPF